MQDGLRLAGGAARERDQARVARRRARRAAPARRRTARSSGTSTTGQSGAAASSSARLRSSATISAGGHGVDAAGAGPWRAAARCTAARRRRCGSTRPSRRPTRGGCRSASSRRRRGRRRGARSAPASARCASRDLAEAPLAPRAVARELDAARAAPAGARVDDVARRSSCAVFSPVTRPKHDSGAAEDQHGRSRRPVHREDRRAEGDHRDGPPVRRRADPAERRALRPRGRVPGADRRADEGARAVRRHDPRGVRRDGARPDDLRDDRRGALARLDLDLGRRQHALHRLLPADEVRHRGAEAEVPAADGDRRDPRRLLAVRARARLRRAGDQDDRQEAATTAPTRSTARRCGSRTACAPTSSSCSSRPTRTPSRATRA